MQYWDIRREVRGRFGDEHRLPGIGVYECADGYIFLMIGVPGFGAPLPALIQWMDEEKMAEDLTSPEWRELFGKIDLRLVAQLYFSQADPAQVAEWKPRFEHVDAIISKFAKTKTKMQLYEGGQRRGLLVAPVNTPKDVVENPQLNHRQWFVEVEHPELSARVKYPGPPFRMIETPWAIYRRPPLLGEHNRQIYLEELGLSRQELEALRAAGVI